MQPLSDLLRHLRTSAKISQLELSLRLGFSARHISFVESGRAFPSRELLSAWLEEVGAPTSIRNAAFLGAGYAHGDMGGRSDQAVGIENAPDRDVFRQLLALHDPFPAFVFAPNWMIVDANAGAEWLMALLMPEFMAAGGHESGVDMIEALLHADGLFSRMRSPRGAAEALVAQLQTEMWANPSIKPRIDEFASSIEDRFTAQMIVDPSPVGDSHFNFIFDTKYGALSFFRFQSIFSLPQDVTSSCFRAEIWFPGDQLTKTVMLNIEHTEESLQTA